MAKVKNVPPPAEVVLPPTRNYFIGFDVHTYTDQKPLRLQSVVRCGSVEEAIPLAAADLVKRIKEGEDFSR